MTVAKLNTQLEVIEKSRQELDALQTALFRQPDAAGALKEQAGFDPSTAICAAKLRLDDYAKTIRAFMETAKIDWPEI